jgi:hypothetical protein
MRKSRSKKYKLNYFIVKKKVELFSGGNWKEIVLAKLLFPWRTLIWKVFHFWYRRIFQYSREARGGEILTVDFNAFLVFYSVGFAGYRNSWCVKQVSYKSSTLVSDLSYLYSIVPTFSQCKSVDCGECIVLTFTFHAHCITQKFPGIPKNYFRIRTFTCCARYISQ